jgi:hypothetical protein
VASSNDWNNGIWDRVFDIVPPLKRLPNHGTGKTRSFHECHDRNSIVAGLHRRAKCFMARFVASPRIQDPATTNLATEFPWNGDEIAICLVASGTLFSSHRFGSISGATCV